MTLLLVAVSVTLVVSSLCSLFEAVLYSTRRATLEAARLEEPTSRLAERFLGLKQEIALPTAAILILNTVAHTSGATMAGMYAAGVLGPHNLPVFSAAFTLAILVLSEILPKVYGTVRWRDLWPVVTWPLVALKTVFLPVAWVIQQAAQRWVGSTVAQISEEEVKAMIRLGATSGSLTRTEAQLLDAVFLFDETLCGEVLLARDQVVWLDVDAAPADYLPVVRRANHTRYPLCEGGLDRVIGIVHIKDLVGAATEPPPLDQLCRPVQRASAAEPVSRLLRRMQRDRTHLAVVADAQQRTLGIVTVDQLLERIVGRLPDELELSGPRSRVVVRRS